MQAKNTSEPSFNPLPTVVTDRGKARRAGRNRRSWETIRVTLLIDLIAVLFATVISMRGAVLGHRFLILCLVVIGWIFLIWTQKGYSFHSRVERVAVQPVVVASVTLLAVLGLWVALSRQPEVIRPLMVIGVPLGCVLLIVGRILSSEINQSLRRKKRSKLLLLGRVRDIKEILGNDPATKFPFHEVTALLVTDPANLRSLPEVPNCKVQGFKLGDDIVDAASVLECDSIWVASVHDFGQKHLRRLMWSLRDHNIRLYLEPMIEGTSGTRISSERIGSRSILYVEPPRFDAANGYLKRAMDVFLSLVILIVISPIMLVTALAIKLEDRGPVFYKSERIGIYGQPYMVWKFRSMAVDADKRRQQLIEAQGGGALLFKMKDDPRVTKVGKFIRKYSIDELPQFFNTLNGTMSIVGPRPPLPREVNEYDIDMRMRLEVRPGITGLWQVSGRSDLTPQQAQALDLYYVDNWSPMLDAKIFFQTFGAVLRAEGAY